MVNPVKLAGEAIERMWTGAGRAIDWIWNQSWNDPIWRLTSNINIFVWSNILMGVDYMPVQSDPSRRLTYYPGYLFQFGINICAYPLALIGMIPDNVIVALSKIIQRGFQIAGYGKGKSWLDWNLSLDPHEERRTDRPFRFFAQCGDIIGCIPGFVIGCAAVAAYHVAAFSIALPLSIAAFSIAIATPIINFFAKCALTCITASLAAVGITAVGAPVGVGTFIAGLASYGWSCLKSLASCLIPCSSQNDSSTSPATPVGNATPVSPTSVSLMRTFNHSSSSSNSTVNANPTDQTAPRTVQFPPLPRVIAIVVKAPSSPSQPAHNEGIVVNERRM